MKRLAAFLGVIALLVVAPAANATVTSIISSIEATGEVPGTLEVAIDIRPNSLNSYTKGEYVTCYVTPSEGYKAQDIEVSTVHLEGLLALPDYSGIIDHDLDGINELMVKFDRGALLALFDGFTGNIDLTLTGCYTDGVTFFGIDSVHFVSH
ncbi:MAG: hypothetical protein ACFFAY_04155 [Promethearchaeota archaeon]